MTVADGVDEVIKGLEEDRFGDPVRRRPLESHLLCMSRPPIPLFDVRLTDDDLRAVEETLRSGWLTMGPRTAEFEALFAEHLGVKHALATRTARPRCTSRTWRPAWARATR